ncbi:MAG: hypothetical protein KAU03_03250 [Candidatus Altiarchaeales archaeon]|nr:hypothetical protein [Candidatus Altiarchaeales archaeon]
MTDYNQFTNLDISYAIHDLVEENDLGGLVLDEITTKKLKDIAKEPYENNHKDIVEQIRDHMLGKEIDLNLIDVAERIKKVEITAYAHEKEKYLNNTERSS